MKKIGFVLVLLAIVSLVGCATLGLPDGATSEQKKAAMCADARTAVALADVWIPVVSDEALAYWTTYRAGADMTLVLLGCPPATP